VGLKEPHIETLNVVEGSKNPTCSMPLSGLSFQDVGPIPLRKKYEVNGSADHAKRVRFSWKKRGRSAVQSGCGG
jgi:hypothetical protein